MASRFFLVPEGRTFTPPQGLLAGPGATHLRHEPGSVVELDADRCVAFSRFVNGRLRVGDLVELKPEEATKLLADAPAPAALPLPDPSKPPMPLEFNIGKKKES